VELLKIRGQATGAMSAGKSFEAFQKGTGLEGGCDLGRGFHCAQGGHDGFGVNFQAVSRLSMESSN
jgi:hypothetical protein